MSNGLRDVESKILVIDSGPESGVLLNVSHEAEGALVCVAEGPVLTTAAHDVDFIIVEAKLPDVGRVVESLREWSDVPIVLMFIEHADFPLGINGSADSAGRQLAGGQLFTEIHDALQSLVQEESPIVVNIGDLNLDLSKRSATMAGEAGMLTPTEFELLKFLVINAGYVVTHEQLLSNVWAGQDRATNMCVRVMVHRLREKIESDPSRPMYIRTQPRIGYRLVGPRGSWKQNRDDPGGSTSDTASEGRPWC